MEDRFRFSIPPQPTGEPIEPDELERILRAKVAEHSRGSQEHYEAQWQLGRFLSMTGRQQEALEIVDTLLESTADPELRAALILGMGQLMEQLGEFSSAIAAYSRAVALEPVGGRTWYLLHNNLGYCLNHVGQYADAERWCRVAIQIDPLRHNAHKNLGLAYQGQGRHVEAARSFIEAVHCEAGDPRALYHLQELVDEHPELADAIPDIQEQIQNCAKAVEAVQQRSFRKPGP